jgi:hypothetical protein
MNPPSVPAVTPSDSEICEKVKKGLSGDIGDTVAAHSEMILKYYKDVQDQAIESFSSAKRVALIGFGVLLLTLLYTLVFDALGHFDVPRMKIASKDLLTVASIGVVSGVLIEFIAAINFWLYAKAARQFNAFHICLERTHRYLLAYKMIEKITDQKRDETLEKVVCIMANAPMIPAGDIGTAEQPPK